MSELLTIDSISVSYGNIKALKEVSMHVDEGDIVCLIGANGAGKSTLLKAIVGLEPITTGTISYGGKSIASAGPQGNRTSLLSPWRKAHDSDTLRTDEIAGLGVALVPEGRRVFADMTVEENLDMGAFLVRDDEKIARKKEEMFDFFPILGARRKQKTRSLSGGEQQMMAIARALMSSPRLLLLDEPGLGLAPLIIQDIFAIIQQLKEAGNTILIVEQNAFQTLKIADYAYVLELGRVSMQGPANELIHDETLVEAYLGGQKA